MTKAAELAKMGEVLTNSQIGGRRNILINGAMQVAQRGTSSTGLGATSGYYTLDRFKTTFGSTAGRLTMSQVAVTDLPGFANALKLDCTTADTSIAAGENFRLQTLLEGQDLQQLKKGTSSAEKFTVSFYVKGNASATYMLELFDGDNSRHNTQQFAVTSSWNRISLTFAGDTTGAFDDDNAVSLYLNFWLHAGSTYTGGTYTANTWASNTNANRAVGISSFFDSTDRTLEITGLQLEVGSQATPFEHRSFGEELQLCQRYYYERCGSGTALGVDPYHWILNGVAYNTTTGLGGLAFPVNMRKTPTLGYSAVAHFEKVTAGRGDEITALNLYDGAENATSTTAYVQFNSGNSTAGGAYIATKNASARLNFDAEL